MRQIITLVLVVVGFFLIPAFSYDNSLASQTKPLTPEAEYYQVPPDYPGKETFDKAKQEIEDVAENVAKKLNLNKPLPEGTKKFVHQVQDSVENPVGPITGPRIGIPKKSEKS